MASRVINTKSLPNPVARVPGLLQDQSSPAQKEPAAMPYPLRLPPATNAVQKLRRREEMHYIPGSPRQRPTLEFEQSNPGGSCSGAIC